MFNSPILDVAIGLVFIFLLYSLLATSIKEAIATLFSLRASMLKKAIVENMLANTPPDVKWLSILKGVLKLLKSVIYLIGFFPKKKEEKKKLGDKFYDHALIKNYGATRIFPLPSYIPSDNFSTVLIDVLKKDFDDQLDKIAAKKHSISKETQSLEEITRNLSNSNAATKIKELLDYYCDYYSNIKDEKPKEDTPNKEALNYYMNLPEKVKTQHPAGGIIDRDTCKILRMHLKNSVYDMDTFTKKLEDWFNDSMDRVSGWYKRQVQTILFIIGLGMAITFNVDVIQIADKLTTDKDARDKLVELAIKGAEQYKNDPRVNPISDKDNVEQDSTKRAANDKIFKEYQSKLDSVKKELKGNIDTANNLLAIGWSGYGRADSVFLQTLNDKIWIGLFYMVDSKEIMDSVIQLNRDSINRIKGYNTSGNGDNSKLLNKFYQYQYQNYPIHVKTAYVWYAIKNQKKKLLGFLILAFAVCLGSPFWFDLLNKLIKIRGAGKKEESTNQTSTKETDKPDPVNINLNNQKPGEEAVG